MHFQPLASENLAATQRIASELFPWETEHQTALAAVVKPRDYGGFYQSHRLRSLQCWTISHSCDAVAGLALLYGYEAQPDEVWLAWFGLQSGLRGAGNGRKALQWVLDQARREGRSTVRLWTTDEPEYAAATHLYAREGFVAELCPALPGEDWHTFVFSLGLAGQPVRSWGSLQFGELCGRETSLCVAAA